MMSDKGTPKPWEQQEGEGAKPYADFCVYRDLGTDRTLVAVEKKVKKSTAYIQKLSCTHNWVKRAQAWDTEQDRIARELQTKEIVKMRKRHADIATAMLLKAARALKSIPDEEIKAQDISRMVDVASKLERLSRGDTSEVIEQRDGGEAVSPVQFYIPSNGRDQGEDE